MYWFYLVIIFLQAIFIIPVYAANDLPSLTPDQIKAMPISELESAMALINDQLIRKNITSNEAARARAPLAAEYNKKIIETNIADIKSPRAVGIKLSMENKQVDKAALQSELKEINRALIDDAHFTETRIELKNQAKLVEGLIAGFDNPRQPNDELPYTEAEAAARKARRIELVPSLQKKSISALEAKINPAQASKPVDVLKAQGEKAALDIGVFFNRKVEYAGANINGDLLFQATLIVNGESVTRTATAAELKAYFLPTLQAYPEQKGVNFLSMLSSLAVAEETVSAQRAIKAAESAASAVQAAINEKRKVRAVFDGSGQPKVGKDGQIVLQYEKRNSPGEWIELSPYIQDIITGNNTYVVVDEQVVHAKGAGVFNVREEDISEVKIKNARDKMDAAKQALTGLADAREKAVIQVLAAQRSLRDKAAIDAVKKVFPAQAEKLGIGAKTSQRPKFRK